MSKRTRSYCAYCNLPRAAIRDRGRIVREFPACVAHLDLLAVDPSYAMDGYLADLDGVPLRAELTIRRDDELGAAHPPRSPRARDRRGRFSSSASSSVLARAMSP